MMNETRSTLRHFLAALAYRTQKALRGAPEDFPAFRAGNNVRTPHELIWHMASVLGYARTFFHGGTYRPERLPSFAAEVERYHTLLTQLARDLDSEAEPRGISLERLLQGPLSDVMTHVGQLAMLRRLAGAPIPPENFIFAEVTPDNLGPDQRAPVAPDPGWSADQPPQPSGPASAQ